MRVFREWAPGAPNDITAALNLTTAPPLPVVPEEWHGRKVIALIAVSAGPIDEAESHFGRSEPSPSRSPIYWGRCPIRRCRR